MASKRDTYRYVLKDGHKTVYVGTTNDPERRMAEHEKDGKKFSKMTIEGPKVTDDSARNWEGKKLKTYRKNQGKNPKYNKDSDG